MRHTKTSQQAGMLIKLSPRFCAKLRRFTAELELPAEYVRRQLRQLVTSSQLVDIEDEFWQMGWIYKNRAQAERIAIKLFLRCPHLKTRRVTYLHRGESREVTFLNRNPVGLSQADTAAWHEQIRQPAKGGLSAVMTIPAPGN